MKADRDINFTDEQGNEFFVKVRDEKVVVFKNKTKIDSWCCVLILLFCVCVLF